MELERGRLSLREIPTLCARVVPRTHHLRHCDPARLALYFHVICRDSDSKAFHSLPSRWFKNCAGFHVEAGAVPGADHFIVFDLTFPQRSAAMRTSILNCVQSSTRIENGNCLPCNVHELPPFQILALVRWTRPKQRKL